ncbi:Bromodomain containing protein [Tritrichomonas foetus]|uniref:Bromodomain containing protein n=1 Tax=Tritrichomonas foetus TaxID=1144522 RepID=A0A1J4K7U6_9EUKA|nr:Bromodomain containing protein [Tritrichomonas foetus]|eukprot:OHT05788.1 Bromodomain containing protein [Tritrichomonas foetus]
MNDEIRKAAIKVMDLIIAHPIANDFIEPIKENDGMPDYFEIVKNPQDLSTIKTRLSDSKYSNVQQWIDDVELVWSNAEQYYGAQNHNASIAAECRRLFTKYKRSVDALSMGTWCGEVYRLRSKLYDLMGQPPARVKQYASSLGAAHTMKQNMPRFTEREFQSFIAASEMLTGEEDQKEMLKIIDEMQPEIDPGTAEIHLDLTKLSLPTLYALRDYMRTTLEKRGSKYPE